MGWLQDAGLGDFNFVQPSAMIVRLFDVGVLLAYFIGALIAYIPSRRKERLKATGAG